MEFLMYLMATIALFLVWKKPEKESLAFGIFWASTLLSIVVFIIAASASWVPGFNL